MMKARGIIKGIITDILILFIIVSSFVPYYASAQKEETIVSIKEVFEGKDASGEIEEIGIENEVETTKVDLGLTSKASILMEVSTGKVIYAQNENERLSPASITKIMTLVLIFDALKEGKIALADEVTTSAYAKSMGGSQVFLEEGEVQSVETLIKCIVVASGNDASVAMAEYLCQTETEFVNKMNERAKGLGMTDTHFVDCTGLSDSDEHYTSAKDVAIMSKELVYNYPKIFEYSTIWMENIIHKTNKGESEFGLSNTNKLIKSYPGALGLKTGSTSKAKYCVSAVARRNDIELIAVVMGAKDYKIRFSEASSLLNYGFNSCKLYKDENLGDLKAISVKKGTRDKVKTRYEEQFTYLSTENIDLSEIKKEMVYNILIAPVKKDEVVGYAVYSFMGKEIGRVNIVAETSVDKATFIDFFRVLLQKYWLS